MELAAQQNAVAELIDGSAVDESDRVAICIKGSVKGFAATLEAFMTGWPFSTSYTVETGKTENQEPHAPEQAKITLIPRIGQGFFSFFSHIFLFEAKGMSVDDKKLENKFIINYDNREPAIRLLKYPGIADILLTLENDCKLKELVIKTDAGIYLVQATSFQHLDLDLCKATFTYLGQITQVLAELF